MAIVFSLSVECGANKASAELLSQHFDNIESVLSNGERSQFITSIFEDMEDNW